MTTMSNFWPCLLALIANNTSAVDSAHLVFFFCLVVFFFNSVNLNVTQLPAQKQVRFVSLGSLCFVPERMTCSQSVCVYFIQQLVLGEAMPKHTLWAARTLRTLSTSLLACRLLAALLTVGRRRPNDEPKNDSLTLGQMKTFLELAQKNKLRNSSQQN